MNDQKPDTRPWLDAPEHGVWYETSKAIPSPYTPVYALREKNGWEARMYFDGFDWHELDKDNLSRGVGWTPDYWTRLPKLPELPQ